MPHIFHAGGREAVRQKLTACHSLIRLMTRREPAIFKRVQLSMLIIRHRTRASASSMRSVLHIGKRIYIYTYRRYTRPRGGLNDFLVKIRPFARGNSAQCSRVKNPTTRIAPSSCARGVRRRERERERKRSRKLSRRLVCHQNHYSNSSPFFPRARARPFSGRCAAVCFSPPFVVIFSRYIIYSCVVGRSLDRNCRGK